MTSVILLFRLATIGITGLLTLGCSAAKAEGKALDDFSNLSGELRNHKISSIEVIARNYFTTIPFRASPEILVNNTPVDRCDIALTGDAKDELLGVISRLEIREPIKDPDLYWRIQFRDFSNAVAHTLYMGRSYQNSSLVDVIFDGVSSEVSVELVRWFEANIDVRQCLLRAAPRK